MRSGSPRTSSGTPSDSAESSPTAGLPPIRLHALRHSLAFWLHSLGLTPADCAALLGHRVDVFLSTYLPESGGTGANHAATVLGKAVASVG